MYTGQFTANEKCKFSAPLFVYFTYPLPNTQRRKMTRLLCETLIMRTLEGQQTILHLQGRYWLFPGGLDGLEWWWWQQGIPQPQQDMRKDFWDHHHDQVLLLHQIFLCPQWLLRGCCCSRVVRNWRLTILQYIRSTFPLQGTPGITPSGKLIWTASL